MRSCLALIDGTMQAQDRIGIIPVFSIQCLPGSGKPWKDFQDGKICETLDTLHKLPTIT